MEAYLLDIFLFLLMLISGVYASIRGLTRELISMLVWIGSFALTVYLAPSAFSFVIDDILSETLLNRIIISICLFLVILIISNFLGKVLVVRLVDFLLSGIDRPLGFIYGVLRLMLVVSFIYVGYGYWSKPGNNVDMIIENSYSRVWLFPLSRMLETVIPSAVDRFFLKVSDPTTLDGALEEMIDGGYSLEERGSLDRLLGDSQGANKRSDD